MFKWIPGRQAGGYSKMALMPEWLTKTINCDAYLLKFPSGCSVAKHRDPVEEGFKHYRANIVVKRPITGGRMFVLGPVFRWMRLEVFRPDLFEHGLKPIEGSMYMLSFGCKVKAN